MGIKCKKSNIAKSIDAITDKLQGILKIPAMQNITKNRMDIPVHEQSISSPKTEAIREE